MLPYTVKIAASAVASVPAMGDFQLTEDETVTSFPDLLKQPYDKHVPKACATDEGCSSLFCP